MSQTLAAILAIPYHPLFVHLPVVMVPLTTIGVIAIVARPAWYERYRWLVLIGAALSAIGTLLADNTGESLEAKLAAPAQAAIKDHTEDGGLANILTVLFFLAVAAWIAGPWYLKRRANGGDVNEGPSWLKPALSGLAVVLGLAATLMVFVAGHSGATEVWKNVAAAFPVG